MPLPAILTTWLSGLKGDGSLIEKIGDAVDKNFTSKRELELKYKEIQLEESKMEHELNKIEVQAVTERHANDMMSDNWLSKNVRPMIGLTTLILIMLFTTLDAITSIGFDVPEHWVKLWVAVFSMIIAFYFGSRGAEKIMKIWASTKNKKQSGA